MEKTPVPQVRKPVEETDDDTGATAEKESLLDAIVDNQPVAAAKRRIDGVLIGYLATLEEGVPKVVVPDINDTPLSARSLCALTAEHVGAQCAIMFESGDPKKPLLMGMLHHSVLSVTSPNGLEIERGEGSLRVEATSEISLHCGKASIRMLQNGRIELRGTTVVSHSTGLNRIRGASVKLN